ncbi:glycosyltransferase family 2 protein [Colwelliaceae bacterium 6471]
MTIKTITSPLVSIIIPVFNDEKYILDSIKSVLSQHYKNIEVIVVDDGSRDNSAQIINAIPDNRVKYIYQENSGSAVARNTGISHAKGEYIAFNDGDDLWAPGRLEQQVSFHLTHPQFMASCGIDVWVNEDFVIPTDCKAQHVNSDDLIITDTSGWMYTTLLQSMPYHIINLLLTAELAKKLTFNAELRRGQDYDYWLQISQHTPIAHLNANYGYYRQRPDSISRQKHHKNYKLHIIENAINKYGLRDPHGNTVTDGQLLNIYYHIHFEYGYELYNKKDYQLALSSFNEARSYTPFKKGVYKFIVLCWLHLMMGKCHRA